MTNAMENGARGVGSQGGNTDIGRDSARSSEIQGRKILIKSSNEKLDLDRHGKKWGSFEHGWEMDRMLGRGRGEKGIVGGARQSQTIK